MTVRRIAVSLAPELESEIRNEARATGQSVSRWLAEAAASQLRQRNMDAFITEYEAEHGVITDAEMAPVRAAWPD